MQPEQPRQRAPASLWTLTASLGPADRLGAAVLRVTSTHGAPESWGSHSIFAAFQLYKLELAVRALSLPRFPHL